MNASASLLGLTLAILLASALPALASAQSGDAEERAMTLYATASLRYQDGRFEDAVALLREAIAVHDAPAFHYNLGRALQELGQWREARAEYAMFLEREPGSTERTRIEARIALLDRRIAEASATRAGPAPRPRDTRPASATSEHGQSGAGAWPWIVAGTGAVVLVGGIVSAAVFESSMSTARNDPVHETASDAYDRAEVFGWLATVGLIAGGVITAVGVGWGIFDLTDGTEAEPSASVRIGIGRLELSGRF